MYRFYQNEYHKNKNNKHLEKTNKKLAKLEKEFKKYKKSTDKTLNSYNSLLNSLFVYNHIEPKELVKLSRQLTLELVDFIDNVCKKHDLQWWMFAGTLLGAIRHEGYIPWDDDIDLNMMRDDYEKFYKIFPIEIEEHGMSDHIEVNTSTITATGYYLPFMKVNYWLGHENLSFLDIFPTDYMIDLENTSKKIHKKGYKKIRERLENGENREIVLNDAFKEQHVSKEKTDIILSGVEEPTFYVLTNNESMFPLTKLKFEDRYYPCPKDYKNYIIQLYGENYKRVPKNAYVHGYYEYLSGHENVNQKLKDAINKLHEVNENF